MALTLPVLAYSTTAAFSFSVPSLTVTAGPGLGSGPTVFNTYVHDLTTIGSGAAASAAANAYAAPSYGASYGAGWVPPLGPACPALPGGFDLGAFMPSVFSAYPAAADQAAYQECGSQALEDNTFATSFYTAGTSPFGGLCNAYIAGNAPQEFALQFY